MSNFNLPQGLLKRKKKETRQRLPSDIFAGNKESLPSKIIIYLKNKVDLDPVDRAIKFKYKKLKEEIPNLEKEIDDFEQKANTSNIISEKEYYREEVRKKREFVSDLINNNKLNQYCNETKELLSEYKKNYDEEILNQYISKAREYISIEIFKETKKIKSCKICHEDLDNLKEDIEGIIYCPSCDCVIECPSLNKYSKDLDHYNNIFEEDITNFIKVLDKFEGKNAIDIPDNLFEDMDKYFLERDMMPGEYYQKLPLLTNGKKEGTGRKKIWEALEHLSYNNLYDESSYITHVYWGWRLPDLTLYRDQILKDYQNTQQVWLKIKNDYKRSASLGTQYRLYVQLMAVGYPDCEMEDFKIQDMVESLRLHNNAWERMCLETNIKFFPVST